MKILTMIESYLPTVGGAEMHAYYLTKQLLRMGFSVEIITGKPKNMATPTSGELCPIYRYKIPSEKILFLPLWVIRVSRHARHFDIIHAHFSSYFAFIAVIVGRLLDKQVIVSLHGSGTRDSSVAKSLWRRLFRYISIKYANCVIATSLELREVALRFTVPEKIRFIPSGVDSSIFIPDRPRSFQHTQKCIRIATLGRIVRVKGLHFLLDAIILHHHRFNFTLDIIGDGSLKATLEKKVKDNGLNEKVNFHGMLTHEEIKRKLQDVDCVVFLSTAESTSLAALECMSMGCLVLTSNAGAFPEFIRDNENGFMVDIFARGQSNYNAPESLSAWQYEKVIDKLTIIQNKSPEELMRISNNARKFVVNKFSWETVTRRIVDECYTCTLFNE